MGCHGYSILLDGERWRQSDVPPEIQRVTQQLEEGLFISEEGVAGSSAHNPPGKRRVPNILYVTCVCVSVLTSQTSLHAEKFLIVHSQRFPVVRWAWLLILVNIINTNILSPFSLPPSPLQCSTNVNKDHLRLLSNS